MSIRFHRLLFSLLPGSGTGPQMPAAVAGASCGQIVPCDQGRCGLQGLRRAPAA